MTTKNILLWEYIREIRGQKYILVKKTDEEYFLFRTPAQAEKSQNQFSLENWEGEIVPWGGVPAKVRGWLARKKVKADPKKQEILIPERS